MCSHTGDDNIICEQCTQEADYEQWKIDNRCPHGVAKENCSTCTPR